MNLRKVWTWEREQLRAHLLRLDTADRRLRFCLPANDAFIHAYCDRIDWSRTTAVGFFADRALRGVAELVRIPDSAPVSAEIAVSVEHGFQGQGIGTRLLEKTLLLARNRFIDTVYLLSLRENEPVQRLARRFGVDVMTEFSAAEGHLRLAGPSYLSQIKELGGDGHALVGAVFELPVEMIPADAQRPAARLTG